MKHSEILRLVRNKIAIADDRRFICYTIFDECDRIQQGSSGLHLKAWVRSLMGGCYTLETWLVLRGYAKENSFDIPANADKVKRTRLAWLDWMIAHWEAKGN